MNEKEAATEKAIDLIEMAIAKTRLLLPQPEQKLSVTPNALIIGGGVSGMTAALNLANQGFTTYLIEKENRLGGLLNDLYLLYPTQEDASHFLNEIVEKIEKNNTFLFFGLIIKAIMPKINTPKPIKNNKFCILPEVKIFEFPLKSAAVWANKATCQSPIRFIKCVCVKICVFISAKSIAGYRDVPPIR